MGAMREAALGSRHKFRGLREIRNLSVPRACRADENCPDRGQKPDYRALLPGGDEGLQTTWHARHLLFLCQRAPGPFPLNSINPSLRISRSTRRTHS